MSSVTETLISEVFKRPLLWDHRTKDYHNRDFVDKGWRNHSRTLHLYLVYTQIYVDMQNRVLVITQCNDDFELLHVYKSFHLPRYRTSRTVEKSTKYVSHLFGRRGNRVMNSGDFELSTAICIKAATIVS
jgi:hypothetical protein